MIAMSTIENTTNLNIDKSKIRKDFALYVSQSILAMIGFSAYILADTYFVANGIGTMALAGLNIALPIYSIILGIGMLISVGGSTFFAVVKARGDHELGNKIFTFAVTIAVVFGIIFLFLGRTFSEELAFLFGGDEVTVPYASTYIHVVSTFSVPFMLNNIIVAFIRNDNAPKFATASLLASNLSNCIMDWIFIYLCKIGMKGAALATGLSPIIGLCVLSIYFVRRKNTFKMLNPFKYIQVNNNLEHRHRKNKFFWIFKNVFVLGLSNFIIEISSGLSIVSFNIASWSIAGNLGVSAYSIVANISFVVNALFNGIGQGMQPLISRCHGKGDNNSKMQVIRLGLITAFSMAIVLYAILYVFSTPFSDIFNKTSDPELNAMGSVGIRCYFVAYFFAGLNIVIAASMNAQESAIKSLLITVSRGLLLLVPAIAILAQFGNIVYLWFALPVSEFITLAFVSVMYLRSKEKNLVESKLK